MKNTTIEKITTTLNERTKHNGCIAVNINGFNTIFCKYFECGNLMSYLYNENTNRGGNDLIGIIDNESIISIRYIRCY